MIYYLGLGSNLGAKSRNLAGAVRRLEDAGIRVVRTSSLYRTEPVDVSDQPWFLNAVVKTSSGLAPESLLERLQGIERAMGRVRTRPKGPRTIDLDILLAGRRTIRTERLTVPHPRLATRRFVLVPLAEIAPRAVHPGLRKSVESLRRAAPDRCRVRKLPAAPGFPAERPGRSRTVKEQIRRASTARSARRSSPRTRSGYDGAGEDGRLRSRPR
ncbi:MAG: 2-amino-4-hydroxy-6-hydroxymethyldihydropteridine diphosphokinase [Candidatus Aminicenantes bacterium]|nr:2-amino-4-hydroxy-6-hydroxymethyldihydropteridine diphosphokinase [Candidatus Aminicenantes bacterium]